MRRSVLAVVLTVVAALLASVSGSPTAAAPTGLSPAGIGHSGNETGNFYTSPGEYFEGEEIKLTANFPSDAASLEVTYFKETSPGSGDYTSIGTDDANRYGNAYLANYQVDSAQEVFARTSDGDVTELHDLEPKTFNPDACTESGSMYASPSFITPGQKVKLTANFPSDQGFVDVTFFKKVGSDLTPIGSDESNKYGNAYLTEYQVDAEQDVYALTAKGVCSPTITLTPTLIDPANFTEDGSIKTDPGSVRDGRIATIVANFPSGPSFNVTAFELKNGVWQSIGSDESNQYGNAYITGHQFDDTETIMAVTDDGRRTPVVDIETIPPNVVSGGPSTLGKNVVYVTTDSGTTPKTKGVDYKGKAVIEFNGALTETLDVDTIAVRGNSSATKPKKPYKLKFEDKQKPFGMKSDKTWILLANYGDWTLIRSMVAWDLGKQLDGLRWTPDSRFAELFLNGKYMGSYQMVESIKIDKNRVNVSKTTGQVIEFDPHWKEDGVPGMVGESGVNYAWKDPDEFKDGGADPEGLTNAKISAMKQRIRAFEDVLYGPSGNRDWKTYKPTSPENDWTTYLDMDSAVDYYLAREFTKDNDADMYRSNFFYANDVAVDAVDPSNPADPDKFFMGPIWDFDRSAGAKPAGRSTTITEPTGWWMRGNGSQNHDTNKIHWYTRITDDPRFLAALDQRWAETRQNFEAVGPQGISTAVRKLGGGTGATSDADYDLGKQVAANDRKIWASFGGRYPAKTSSYTGELNWVRNWYNERFDWMDAQLTD